MMMTAFCFLGFFKQMAEENTKDTTPKKNKKKQNKQTEISLVLYLSTHT